MRLKHSIQLLTVLFAMALMPGQRALADDWAANVFRDAIGPSVQAPSGGAARRSGSGTRAKRTDRNGGNQLASAEEVGNKAERARRLQLLNMRPQLPASTGKWRWRVRKSSWSDEDERRFAQLVISIGESNCGTVHDCITSAQANPSYSGSNPPGLRFYSDCADLPYFLRAYFAWKNHLPFSFSVRYSWHQPTPGSTPKVHGNKIVDRFDIVGPGPDGRLAISMVGRFVSTEHFRTPVQYNAPKLPDYYPVKLTRESIRPGTVIFDPDGHIGIVYKVTANGRIHYIDSHPDNTLTRGVYGRDFARTDPQMGAGFKRWRPQKLVGAKKTANGDLVGGKLVLTSDKDLTDWSDEQFFGNAPARAKVWSEGKFIHQGREVDYYDYLRLKLAYPGFKYDPIEELQTGIRGLCQDLKYRGQAVDNAIRAGINKRSQPAQLPKNIFAATGDWELYSTPSRDARLKTSFEEVREEAERFVGLFKGKSALLKYNGSNLRKDLLETYRKEAQACTMTYTKSDGSPQMLSFEEVRKRLFDLSFDPYHCIERRWGATSRDELKSCQDDATKQAWYKAEERLRNQVTRTYGEPMGWGLSQLQNKKLDIGIEEPRDVDILAFLTSDRLVAALNGDEPRPAPKVQRRRGNQPGK